MRHKPHSILHKKVKLEIGTSVIVIKSVYSDVPVGTVAKIVGIQGIPRNRLYRLNTTHSLFRENEIRPTMERK
jgi:hypothetical protein